MTTAVHQGLAPSRERLSNGAVVLAKETHTTPAVAFSVTLQAGSLHDPPERPGVANFLSRAIDRGTSTRSADEIAETLDGRGVSLMVLTTRHLMTLACTCLAEDFETMLDLVADICIHPTFPEEEVETRRGEIITSLRQDEENPAVVAVENLMGLLYGNEHAYGRRAKGTIETVEAIRRSDLQAFHAATFGPSSLVLVVVGDVNAARVTGQAARVFGGWAAAALPANLVPEPAVATSRRQVVTPMMNKVQADVAYGFVAIARDDPGYYPFLVMNNVLGQYALGGRLGDSIRERQGMAYYVFSAFDANVGRGPLLIRAGVDSRQRRSRHRVDRRGVAPDGRRGRDAARADRVEAVPGRVDAPNA